MKTVKKSVLIWYSPAEMYQLVVDVAAYPQFLPWCDKGRVVSLEENGMVAEIGIAFSGIHQTFTTRNAHVENQQVVIKLINGPFSQLEGEWNFVTLGKLVSPVFDKIAGNMVDAFIKRAKQVYGE